MSSPAPSKKSADSIPRRTAIGFAFFLSLVWAAEFTKIPHRFFGEPDVINWYRLLLRTAIILIVWAWVHYTTKRLLKRLHHLEEFLRICSWCQKVGHEGEWLTLEEFFGSKFDTQTSHGICSECAARATGRKDIIPPLPPG